jgi:hypothetical protein
MAMGLPVIATQSPSVAETVAGNGYLVNPLDPHQTFAALRELVGHPELRRTLGRRSRQLALRRSVDDMARRYERVLLDAVAEGRRRRRWRRRVVVVSDRAARGRDASLPALLRVHRALAVGGADVYLIAGHPAAPPSLPGWPPGRRLSVPATARGMSMAELGRFVEWIGPDLAMAASPRIVIRLRRLLRGDEIAFVPDAPRLRAGVARAVELADRVLFSRAAMRAAWARRLPRSSWKFQALSLSSGAGIALRRLVLFLSSGRPMPPVGPTSAARKTARPPARPRRR